MPSSGIKRKTHLGCLKCKCNATAGINISFWHQSVPVQYGALVGSVVMEIVRVVKRDREEEDSGVSSEWGQAQKNVRVSGYLSRSLCSMPVTLVVQQTGETRKREKESQGQGSCWWRAGLDNERVSVYFSPSLCSRRRSSWCLVMTYLKNS